MFLSYDSRTDSLEVRIPGESLGDVGSTPTPFIIITFRSFSFTFYKADRLRTNILSIIKILINNMNVNFDSIFEP